MIGELILLIGSITVFLTWTLTDRGKSPKNLPPGPSRLQVIANQVRGAIQAIPPYKLYVNLSRTYGPIVRIDFGALRAVVVNDFALIKEASDIWHDRLAHPLMEERSFAKPLGVFMISGDVDTWKEMRRFTIRTLRDFGLGKQTNMDITVQEEAQDLVESLLRGIQNGNDVICIHQFFSIPVINILWSMFAGTRFSHDDKKLQELIFLIDRILKVSTVGAGETLEVLMAFPLLEKVPFLFAQQRKQKKDFDAELQQFFRNHLEGRRALGDYKNEQRDLVDVFLQKIDAARERSEENTRYTDEQLIVISMDVFIAGMETTNNTIEFALLYLILHPRIQAKVQAEIDKVIGNSRLPSLDDMSNMPYTEAMLLEVSRRASVVPLMLRSPTHDSTLGNYSIPKGSIGILNYYAIHMDENIWENPNSFIPERFLDAQNNIINSEKVLPFGAGSRRCPGEVLSKATVFIFITTVLQRLTFEQSPNHVSPSMEPEVGFTQTPQVYHTLIKERQAQ